jgi:dipeptidase E
MSGINNEIMKLLLTSSGISNPSIHNALVDLLGKPIAECNALFIPTAIYPHPNGPKYAWQAISGINSAPFTRLGWKSLGVWGGDVLYLSYWMQESGLAEILPSLLSKTVYVGVSAGSMAVSTTFGETYRNPPGGKNKALTSEEMVFATPQGEISKTFITGHGAGLVDFGLIPHMNNEEFPDASESNAAIWAAKLPFPVYGIDDQTAIKVIDGTVEVVSEGRWKLFNPAMP